MAVVAVLPSRGTQAGVPGWFARLAPTAPVAADSSAVLQGNQGDRSHDHEPGCAVRRAVEDGSLDDARLRSWDALRKESAAAELRADEHARRPRDRLCQLVARDAQEVKRRGRGG